MASIKTLCQQHEISRATLLYYEDQGLLTPARRPNGYRWYDSLQQQKLERIRALRALGFSLESIAPLIKQELPLDLCLLQSQIEKLTLEIASLSQQRASLIELLTQQQEEPQKMISEKKWQAILGSMGLSKTQIETWLELFSPRLKEDAEEMQPPKLTKQQLEELHQLHSILSQNHAHSNQLGLSEHELSEIHSLHEKITQQHQSWQD
ncbi:MerR family transcriptional regulator [Dongshaea marina]|uniref:MerR family transcriptional regulator n=1 Tax=Dongshaea marina TaxID=2047966 RepID=UPI000D3E39CB|nr:MerR family transcriptional regulator [Dongshaea marina]